MYVIKLNSDNTMVTTRKERIIENSRLHDNLWFLVSPRYRDLLMEGTTAIIDYRHPNSGRYVAEALVLSEDGYNGYLKYMLPPDSRVASTQGCVSLHLSFVNKDGIAVRESINQITLTIEQGSCENHSRWIKDDKYEHYVEYADDNISFVDDLKRISLNPAQVNITQESNSQYIPFVMPRYYDGIDLVDNTILIHFSNAAKYEDYASVINVYYSDTEIKFGWVVDKRATAVAGRLAFDINVVGVDPRGEEYRWKSAPCDELVIVESVSGNGVIEPDPTWMDSFWRKIAEYTNQAQTSNVDNETIGINEHGLMYVKAVPNISVWTSLDAAENYAKTDPTAYVGQPLTVIETVANGDGTDTIAVLYTIQNESGDLARVGTVTLGDDVTIVKNDDDTLSIKGYGDAAVGAQLVKTVSGLSWVVPSTDTVDGFQTAVETLGGRMTDVESKTDENETALISAIVRVAELEAKAHEHANKALLDTYDQTNADIKDAVTKKHLHANASVLDTLSASKIAQWDAAQSNAIAYADNLYANIEDKLATKKGLYEALPLQTLTFEDGAAIVSPSIELNVGDNVSIIIGENEYEDVVRSVYAPEQDINVCVFGNSYIIGIGDDTGQSYLYIMNNPYTSGVDVLIATDPATGESFSGNINVSISSHRILTTDMWPEIDYETLINRPMYKKYRDFTISDASVGKYIVFGDDYKLTSECEAVITINGVTYTEQALNIEGLSEFDYVAFGNPAFADPSMVENGKPFIILFGQGYDTEGNSAAEILAFYCTVAGDVSITLRAIQYNFDNRYISPYLIPGNLNEYGSIDFACISNACNLLNKGIRVDAYMNDERCRVEYMRVNSIDSMWYIRCRSEYKNKIYNVMYDDVSYQIEEFDDSRQCDFSLEDNLPNSIKNKPFIDTRTTYTIPLVDDEFDDAIVQVNGTQVRRWSGTDDVIPYTSMRGEIQLFSGVDTDNLGQADASNNFDYLTEGVYCTHPFSPGWNKHSPRSAYISCSNNSVHFVYREYTRYDAGVGVVISPGIYVGEYSITGDRTLRVTCGELRQLDAKYLPVQQAEVGQLLSVSAIGEDGIPIAWETVNDKSESAILSAEAAMEALEQARTDIDTALTQKVPTYRKINGYTLTGDINLSAPDVGADPEGAAQSALMAALPGALRWNGRYEGRDRFLMAQDGNVKYYAVRVTEEFPDILETLAQTGQNTISAYITYGGMSGNYESEISTLHLDPEMGFWTTGSEDTVLLLSPGDIELLGMQFHRGVYLMTIYYDFEELGLSIPAMYIASLVLDGHSFAQAEGGAGENGATFTPSVDAAGNLSWSNDKGLPDPPAVNLMGHDGKSAYELAVEAGFQGTQAQWLKSLQGTDGISPHIGANGNWYLGTEDTGVTASGIFRFRDVPYAAGVTLPVNTHVRIGTTEGPLALTLGTAVPGYTAEWAAQITQGETAYEITMPVVEWVGDVPSFDAGTTTQIRLFYVGQTLKGVAV